MTDFVCKLDPYFHSLWSSAENSRFICIETFSIGDITIKKATHWLVYILVCKDNKNIDNMVLFKNTTFNDNGIKHFITDFSILEKYFRQIEPESSRPNLRLYKDFVFDYKKDLVFIVALFILLIASWFGLCYLFDVLSQVKL